MLLGRAAGISDEKLAHLGDDPLPPDVYSDEELASVRYSRASTLMLSIEDELYDALAQHFESPEIVELCFVVGLSNLVNRFHATFHTLLDEDTRESLGDASPLPLPEEPGAGAPG